MWPRLPRYDTVWTVSAVLVFLLVVFGSSGSSLRPCDAFVAPRPTATSFVPRRGRGQCHGNILISIPVVRSCRSLPSSRTLLHLSSSTEGEEDEEDSLDLFLLCLDKMSLPSKTRSTILSDVESMGFTSSLELYTFAHDFEERPEVLSKVLREDFGMVGEGRMLRSHQVRAALMRLLREFPSEVEGSGKGAVDSVEEKESSTKGNGRGMDSIDIDEDDISITDTKPKKPLYKSVIVNQKSRNRYRPSSTSTSTSSTTTQNYGLPVDYGSSFPKLKKELDAFLDFMVNPSTDAQESPIREATAIVYIRHARLFLGWYWKHHLIDTTTTTTTTTAAEQNLSIYTVIPDKTAASTKPILSFLLWLRSTRTISDSYEANILRGLSKLLKYRFRDESNSDPSYGEKSYADVPAVRELRKLHKDAEKRRVLGKRSSDEELKWLEWGEYLEVVRKMKLDLEGELEHFEAKEHPAVVAGGETPPPKYYSAAQRRIAVKFQNYLVLAFFSSVPDRQRTFRELVLHKNFLRTATDSYAIHHGPTDYKTGGTYGPRPPLPLPPELTPSIDDFLLRWRPTLLPTAYHLFAQPRTGRPLTANSMYGIVSRSCYAHAGKKTNPHLLRDMVVTHVRGRSDASERELEALALYMGHSIGMQRSSYDRRTVEEKVKPAVELLRAVGAGYGGDDGNGGKG